jgi:hypothetical protein
MNEKITFGKMSKNLSRIEITITERHTREGAALS